MRVHLFPSRTQKLSSCTLTILGGRLPGKIGNANTKPRLNRSGLFSVCKCPPDTCYARTILGLPWKIGNANTKASTNKSGLFLIYITIYIKKADGFTVRFSALSSIIRGTEHNPNAPNPDRFCPNHRWFPEFRSVRLAHRCPPGWILPLLACGY